MLRLLGRGARWLSPLLLVLGMALAGGGWLSADRIAHEALVPRPYSPHLTMTISAVGPDSVTLRGARDDLRRPGTYSLFWPGGFGQLFGEVRGGAAVTRSLRVLGGRAPRVGQRAGMSLDGWGMDDAALALGVRPEVVSYASPLGPVPAWFVPGRGSTWAVLVHGRGGTPAQVLKAMRVPVRMGLPSLAISYRNDRGAPRDPSGEYRYGETEWADLDAAMGWAQDRGAQRFVLVGASMGGTIVVSLLEHSGRAGLVSGIVLDSALLQLDPALDLGIRRRPLPVVDRALPPPVAWLAKRVAAVRHGLAFGEVDHLDDTSWLTVPALVFHGTADLTVPYAQSAELAAAKPALVELVTDRGVGHLRSWNHDPVSYESRETAFLTRVLGH